jgi:ubiquinone/menaquinone biosynthesis C-methylase UbiE
MTEQIKGSQKYGHELNYWYEIKDKEGTLSNNHYQYFYMQHFKLDTNFYMGKKILDVGCGPRGSLEWADMCNERIGLDPLIDSYRKLGIDNHKMKYLKGNLEEIPFEDGYFDIVSSFNSLDHVDDLNCAVSEIKRVLAPGGSFLLLTDVNHSATSCEPVEFSWGIVHRFVPDFKIIDERHFEKFRSGMYESIMQNITYKHLNPKKRYGILSLHAKKI